MKARYAIASLLVAGFLTTLFLFNPEPSTAKIQKGEKRPLLTKHLMSGLVKPFSGDLRKAIGEAKTDPEAWDDVIKLASLLNESSYIMMADKRCPDKVWADACKTLDTATKAVIKAANKKDAAAAGEAAKGIGKSCGSCHKAHKKKKR